MDPGQSDPTPLELSKINYRSNQSTTIGFQSANRSPKPLQIVTLQFFRKWFRMNCVLRRFQQKAEVSLWTNPCGLATDSSQGGFGIVSEGARNIKSKNVEQRFNKIKADSQR